MKYADLRFPDQPTFAEAKAIMLQRAQELAAPGDYSKPARRAAVLGYMFECKQSAWELHIAECEQAWEAYDNDG